MRPNHRITKLAALAALACGLLGAVSARAGWVAYNDSAYKPGQENDPNATTYGLGRNFAGEGQSGPLLNIATGEPTAVRVTFSEQLSTGSVNSAGDAAAYTAETDAEALFAGRVDLSGNMSYGDSPGWWVDMVFSGLNPDKHYTFAGTADRNGGPGYAARVTNWRVLGARGLVYASSPGAQRVAEDSVEFSTGHNPDGLVARWVDIRPAADGTFTIRTSHSVGEAGGGIPGASAFQGYAGGVFLLVEQEDHWEAYNDSAFKPGQLELPQATTYGIGRNFAGEGPGGPLKVWATGGDTTVTAQYVEHFSTGSINSAGDPATYSPGSDAEALFAGKLDLAGNMSYGDSPGWHLDLILSGLDPTRLYTFAATADRNGGPGYSARVTNWRLIGAESATYASSAGAHRVADDSVEFSTGHNPDGLVARWTNIRPGSNGRIIIRTSHSVGEVNGGMPGASAFQGYAGGVFTLRTQPPGEYRWVAYNDSAFKEGQVNADFVTTYGLGRNFQGEASGGVLRDMLSGQATAASAEHTEHFSTGSINSAGDAAPFPPGSDAERWFKGVADLSGNMSYGDSPGWHLDLTFTGLDPARGYTFVGTAHRNGGDGYLARVTNWRLLDADGYAYASSSGAHRVGEDSVEFSTGHNANGLVARWVDIRPGADGTFTIRTSHSVGEAAGGLPGASAYQGYAGGLFLLAEQTALGSGGAEGIEIISVFPPAGSTQTHPNAPVRVVLQTGALAVNADSVDLRLNGATVAAEVLVEEEFTTLIHHPATLFASGSSHTVAVSFEDNAPEPRSTTREWSFAVLDYGSAVTVPASLGVAFNPAIHRARGFALEIFAVDPAIYTLVNLDGAENLLESNLENLADSSIFNPLGYFIETADLNYQVDGLIRGFRVEDRRFPGISGSDGPDSQFALRARTLLHLRPGYHRFNVRMQPEFELAFGTAGAETYLNAEYAECANCSGDDSYWTVEVLVTQEGVYPFRLLFFTTGASSSLEWVVVTPTGSRLLINEAGSGEIPAYVPDYALPPTTELGISRVGDSVVLQWAGGGTLQSAPAVTGQWSNVPNASSPHSAPLTGTQQYFRVRP